LLTLLVVDRQEHPRSEFKAMVRQQALQEVTLRTTTVRGVAKARKVKRWVDRPMEKRPMAGSIPHTGDIGRHLVQVLVQVANLLILVMPVNPHEISNREHGQDATLAHHG
jgi:hypothetical protein